MNMVKIILIVFLFLAMLACEEVVNESEVYYDEVENLALINSDGTDFHVIGKSYGYREKYFVNNDSQILIKTYKAFVLMNLDGSIVKRIPIDMEMRRSCISHDRSTIAFVGTNSEGQEIYLMKYDGTNLRKITHSPTVQKRFPSFSFDDKRIVYATRDKRFPTIEIVDIATGEVSLIRRDTIPTYKSIVPHWYLCFSRDDKYVFYIYEYWDNSRYREDLRAIYLENRNLKILEKNVSILGNIVVSTSSNKIIFMSADPLLHLFVLDYDSMNKIDLGEAPVGTLIDISDDGSKIVYGNESSYYDDEIVKINIDGTGRKILSEGGWPVFSSDASKVLFLKHEFVVL